MLGARYYDPAIGRFLSVDPIMDLTDPEQWNGYAYANSNPVTHSDPTGLKPDGCGSDCINVGGEWGVEGGKSDPRRGSGDDNNPGGPPPSDGGIPPNGGGNPSGAPHADQSNLSAYDASVAQGSTPALVPWWLTSVGWFDRAFTDTLNFGIDTYHAFQDPQLFWDFWGSPVAWVTELKFELMSAAVGLMTGGAAGVGTKAALGAAKGVTRAAGGSARVSTGAARAERAVTGAKPADALKRPGGGSSSARLPMNMESVCSVACKYDIDLADVDVKINKSVAGLYGSTSPDKSVTLYRNAFANEEQLARTLAHERFHVHQIDSGMGYPTTYDAGNKWEQAAVAFEDAWWASQ
jgi:hypothetical protein